MKLEIDVHPAQAEILNTLLFNPRARFKDLNQTGLTNDHFTFHVKRLVELGLINKNADNSYSLSQIGKEFANRFDTAEKIVERQAKVAVLIVPIKSGGSEPVYLIQERLKQPFFGFFGWPTGKVKWGERVLDAAARELTEETGLSGKLRQAGIWHKTDYTEDKQLLEDKYFFVVKAENLTGKLTETFDGGKNYWMDRKQLRSRPKAFEGVEEAIDVANSSDFTFIERDYFYSEDEY